MSGSPANKTNTTSGDNNNTNKGGNNNNNNDDQKQTNNVRVTAGKSRFLYVDVTKYLLEEGHQTVDITGLGFAISDVADIVEILKSQGVVDVVKIVTSRDVEGARRRNTDKICVTVRKSKDFDKIFAEQKKQKEALQAERPAKQQKDQEGGAQQK
jgi:DNA-binding protein